ncbi:NUDIX domain-containing protein [Sediminitomix flava]|nr:NUDIX hydrolase [Sediminitomix flava]
MDSQTNAIKEKFGNRLRVRVCGLCIDDNQLLLIKHSSLGDKGFLWVPPGGGVDYGEDLKSALKREFLEETGLTVEVERFLFAHEYLEKPLHAVEFFFRVNILGGELEQGIDPELEENEQIIKEIRFVPFEELKEFPSGTVHQAISKCESLSDLEQLDGIYHYIK